MSKKNSNNLIGSVFVGLAVLATIYFMWNKFFTTEQPTYSGNLVKNEFKKLPEPLDSNLKKRDVIASIEDSTPIKIEQNQTPVKGLESFDILDVETQTIINRIDRLLDNSYQLKPKNANRIKMLDDASALIDSAIRVFNNPFFNASKGDLLMLQGKNIEAVKEYELALLQLGHIESIRRNHAGACYNSAIELIQSNDTDQAIILMESFTYFAPEDKRANAILLDWYKKRAVGLLRDKQNRKGLALCFKAIKLEPNDHIANFNAGIAQFRLSNFEKGIKHFKKCLEINPNDNFSKNYLYSIYVQLGKPELAKEYETEAINIELPID